MITNTSKCEAHYQIVNIYNMSILAPKLPQTDEADEGY